MSITILPSLVISKIAEFLHDETPFRDKVDIAIDAASIQVAGLQELSHELTTLVDPSAKEGKLSPIVKTNLSNRKKRVLPAENAKRVWGLTDEDLKYVPARSVYSSKNGEPMKIYNIQDIKKTSAAKFSHSYENLKAYHSQQQLTRFYKLQEVLTQHQLTPRVDSTFCEKYIKTGKGNPEEIAKVLKEMDFYHLHTEYKKYFTFYTAKYGCEYGYYDRDHISGDAKKRALQEFREKFPDKLNLIPQSLHRFL
jgi:hypothetical protein